MTAVEVASILRTGSGPFVFNNVVISGDLDLKETELSAIGRFYDCNFEDIHTERATLRGSLYFSRCAIERFEAHHAHFNDLRISGGTVRNFAAANASFDKTCSIRLLKASSWISMPGARVSGNLRIKDLPAQRVNLERAAISGLCDLKRLVATELTADGLSAQRLDATDLKVKRASFNRVMIKNAMNLTGVHVEERLDMRSAEVGDDVFLSNSRIGDLDLSGTKSAHALYLERSVIDRTFSITDGRFGYFRCSAKVAGEVFIRDTTFSRVDLNGIRIANRLRFRRNTISGTMRIWQDGAHKPTVGGACSFRGTRLGGQLVISDFRVAKRFSLASLSVVDLDCKALNVGGQMDLTGLSASRIAIANANIEAIVADAVVGATNIDLRAVRCKSFVARGTRITGSLRLNDFDADTFVTTHASYGGEISFVNARITSVVDLTKTSVGELCFDGFLTGDQDTSSFAFPKRTVLRECQYSSLRVNWKRLVHALAISDEYDATAYRALEGYVRSIGRLDLADDIYLQSRRHAATTLPRWRTKRIGQALLEWISGYGAKPWRLLRAALCVYAIIVFTILIIDREHLWLSAPAALDVVLRGDKSDFLGALLRPANPRAPGPASATALLLAGFVLILRYGILALLGVWTAYITGLVRYVGGARN